MLDKIDLQLVAALQNDAKASLLQLGNCVGMSAPSVMERVRKLEQVGVITGYSATVNAKMLGLDITAFIGVSINYPDKIEAFKTWVANEPRVLECHHITGGATLLVKIKCRNTAALEELISIMRSELGAERTETMVVLSTSEERTTLPIMDGLSPDDPSPRPKRRSGSASQNRSKGGG
jgi:Lrp/AsnC family leucine-responsive transcriptional regulator